MPRVTEKHIPEPQRRSRCLIMTWKWIGFQDLARVELVTASHKLVSVIISLTLSMPSTHAHTEIQAEKTIICKYELSGSVCKCARRHACTIYFVHVRICVSVFSVWVSLASTTTFPFPHFSLNACCEICTVYVNFWIFVRKLVMLISHYLLQLQQGDSMKKGGLLLC